MTALDAENRGVILDRTAFYPGGGGQPPDEGTLTIGGIPYPVTRARKMGDQVVHLLAGDEPLPAVGAAAHGQIDWERRYQLMRTHTAMHILCGVIFRDYGASVTGGDMDPLQGRMDFEFETMHKELVTRSKPPSTRKWPTRARCASPSCRATKPSRFPT